MPFRPARLSRPRAGTPFVVLVSMLVVSVVPVSAQGRPDYIPPVDAPISDGFRAPETPFGPGNRGLEYRTEPGTAVRASGDGTVVFAGRAGLALHVTVQHADGVRTSYSFLTAVDVAVGRSVRQGDRLGTTGARLHFGARLGDEYFDPATLFDGGEVEVELVPFEVPPGSSPEEEERDALSRLTLTRPRSLGSRLPDLGAGAGWLADRAEMAGHYAIELDPWRRAVDLSQTLTQRVLFPPPCTGDGTPLPSPAPGRLAVTVGGLGSTSASSSIDRLALHDLGYAPGEVVRYSYAGGQTSTDRRSAFPDIEATEYTSEDTQGDMRAAAERLADLVERVAAERPGLTVDIYAHSMGGIVARLALLALQRRGFPPSRLGVVATLATPHQGADLADLARTASSSILGDVGLRPAEQALDTGLDPDSPAISQLARTSGVIAELAEAGVPDGVELVSVAARGDLVVPSLRAQVADARNVTVPEVGWDAHSDVVASEVTTRELSLALTDMPPRCVGVWDAVQDEVTGHAISFSEDLGSAAMLGVP